MSEWISVIAVFWVLWALDGAKLLPRAVFSVVGGGWRRQARAWFVRWSQPGWAPWSWRVTMADAPLSLSPSGVSNRPAGTAGRPTEAPRVAQAWRWEDVREAGVAKGWLYVNGARFCADTGHLTAPQLLVLARLAPAAREKKIRLVIVRWFRPEQLRRRVRVLAGRTRMIAALNAIFLAGCVALSVFAAGVMSARLSDCLVGLVADVLPWFLLALTAVHFGAAIAAWRTVRRLKAAGPEKRRTNLFSALLMPPQAMRLRALLGEGFFPPMHPLAAVVTLAGGKARRAAAFNTLSDLRWPIGAAEDAPLAREIATWFRAEIERGVGELLARAQLTAEELLAVPAADAPASCRYCPRCGDQFVAGVERCPQGVELRPLRRG